VACSDSFDDSPIVPEGGAGDAASDAASDVTVDANDAGDAPNDARANDSSASDSGSATRLLLSYNGATSSELAAVNVASGAVDGRLAYPGFIGTTTTLAPDPYLLEQANDVVAKLDRAQPWIMRSSWSVKLSDRQDGGASYSDPSAVVVGVGNKAYVLRYTRNQIAIIDTSQTADAGAPLGTIDLAPLVQAHDSDGTVEQTAAVYVPSKGLVYVLLGNIDRKNVSSDGFTILCSQTKATVVAIDVATDKVVKLSGGDTTGALVLSGYNPVLGAGFWYDASEDRLLMMHAGCNQPAGDGGAGPLTGRMIEEVSLFTGATRTLLDLNSSGFPSAFVFIDPRRAIVQLDYTGFETFVWDPSSPSLGPTIPNSPDAFVYDGAGNILGLTSIYGDGGVVTGIDVTSVRIADGKKTKIASNPFMLTGGFVGGVDLWPHP
jgi:hypothetical protein